MLYLNKNNQVCCGDKAGWQRDLTPTEEYLHTHGYGLDLSAAKAQALAELRKRRKKHEYSGCESQGIWWDTDEKSERRLTSATTLMKDANLKEIPNFKPSDGVTITLTLPIAVQAGVDMMLHYGKWFAVEDQLAAQIKDCKSLEELKTWIKNNFEGAE